MGNYVLALSDKVNCANDGIIVFACVVIAILFALFISFVIASACDEEVVLATIGIGIVFICSVVPSLIYFHVNQIQTYTVNESILTDNEAKTELLKDYSIIEKSDGTDGQIYLIKTKDAKHWH
jgi:predicted tellurium resistance membrane protein TerC